MPMEIQVLTLNRHKNDQVKEWDPNPSYLDSWISNGNPDINNENLQIYFNSDYIPSQK
jgi:hypothetical protein